jgi:hypothetical protein
MQVFDFEKWAKHRSPSKYLQQVLSIPRSHTLRSCALPVFWVFLMCLLVYGNDSLVEARMMPRWMRLSHQACVRPTAHGRVPSRLRFQSARKLSHDVMLLAEWISTSVSRKAGVPQSAACRLNAVESPLTITSFALSLLLVFRTNSSYSRFAEARQLWGMVLNRSRDLVRMAITFFPLSDWDGKATFARWTMTFSKCLLCHLRPRSSLREEVLHILSREEIQILLAVNHPTVMCIQVRTLRCLGNSCTQLPSALSVVLVRAMRTHF